MRIWAWPIKREMESLPRHVIPAKAGIHLQERSKKTQRAPDEDSALAVNRAMEFEARIDSSI